MKLSVITINYNNSKGLKRTLYSLIPWLSKVEYSDRVEWIVIDGGSLDGSKEILVENDHLIKFWVSEKDSGVYNAMNKGIDKAIGDYLLFLNSGDCLSEDLFSYDLFGELDGAPIIYGNIIEEDHSGNRIITRQPALLSLDFFIGGSIGHQSIFFSRQLFDKYKYDETYRIAADSDFLIKKIFIEHCKTKYIDVNISVYESFGLSSQLYYGVTRPEIRKSVSQALQGGEYWYDCILFRKELDNEKVFENLLYLVKEKKLQKITFFLLGIIFFVYKIVKRFKDH